VARFHGDSDEVMGSPKILKDLCEDCETISCKTVAQTMRKLGLVGVRWNSWKTMTILDRTDAYPVDVVQGTWDVDTFNQVWVGNISCLRTWEGRLNLATVIDAHSRRVIGWAGDERMRTTSSKTPSQWRSRYKASDPRRSSFTPTGEHNQYASDQITTFADENGFARSMSYTWLSWDNETAEPFFATLKTEFYYRRVWPTKKLARVEVGKWIKGRYNRRRRHASLSQVSPVAFG
jgi:transposase InsO family protein